MSDHLMRIVMRRNRNGAWWQRWFGGEQGVRGVAGEVAGKSGAAGDLEGNPIREDPEGNWVGGQSKRSRAARGLGVGARVGDPAGDGGTGVHAWLKGPARGVRVGGHAWVAGPANRVGEREARVGARLREPWGRVAQAEWSRRVRTGRR